MNSTLRFCLLSLALSLPLLVSAQPFKHKYYDPSVNVNDLIREAEAWFKENGTGPGKGWKGYQRWKYEFERRFYPSGDRSQFDPQMAAKEYATFKKNAAMAKVAGGGNGHWTYMGPDDVANILPTSWAAGLGRIEAVWAGAATADTIYTGSRSGGFWKSVDGGATWRSTTQDQPALGVMDIEVNPLRHNEVWIVTNHAAGYSMGLLRSTDHGETWGTTGLVLGQGTTASEMLMMDADSFYVATNQGVQRSTDGGNTWALCSGGNILSLASHPLNSQILYAMDYWDVSSVQRSTDGGQTWTSHPIGTNNHYPFLATSAAEPNSIWMGSGSGIFKSTNTGLNWTQLSSDPTNSGVMCLGVSATQPNDIYAGSLSHYKSTDGGSTWNMFSDWISFFGANYMHADMRVFQAWGNRIYAGTDGFLTYSSDNGQTWSIIGQGVGVREFYRIGCSVMDAGTVVGGSQDNGTSVMREGAWHEWIGADGMQAHVDYNNPDNWFGTIQFGNLQRTITAGQDAVDVSPGTNGAWITPSVIDPNNENTLFIAYDDVYKSVDNGDHWQQLVNFNSGNFDEIAISPSDSNYLYLSQGSAIRRSTNNGVSWTFINSGLPNQFINRIAVHPDDPQRVVVCLSGFSGGNKVFGSTNGGTNWTNLSGNLPNLPANAIAWADGSPAKMILGMDVGVYYADAGTNAWTLYADSLPAVAINDLEVLNGAGLIRAGTWGRGLWEAPIPGRDGTPQIIRVLNDPVATALKPKPADSVAVTAVIVNTGGIQSATLRWGTSTASQPNLISMAHVAGDSFRATIPNLPSGTRVYYRITAFAPNGDSARTERLMYRVKPGILCAAAGAQGTTFDFIDTVAVASLNNASGQDYYGDFRNIFTALYRDSSYTLMASINYSFPLDSMFVWIDWGKDGEVSQPGDQVIMSGFDAGHNSYGTFTVPHLAVIPDTVTMRVRCIYDANPVADPCGDIFGEVEDYSLVVRDTIMIYAATAFSQGFHIFPNPTADAVQVAWATEMDWAEVRLLDLQGRHVLSTVRTNATSCRLELKELPQGMYLVEVLTIEGVLRGRILVAR